MATISAMQGLINAIATGEENTALRLRNAYNSIVSQFFIGEIKWLKFTPEQILANFDSTGLGTSDAFLGWKICSEDDGRVSIAFGSVYNELGATGGSKDAVVVEHNHNGKISNVSGTDGDKFVAQNGGSGGGTTTASGDGVINVSTEGVVGTDKNMQPYVVELKIIRIA